MTVSSNPTPKVFCVIYNFLLDPGEIMQAPYDVLFVASALANNRTLVTHNVKEHKRKDKQLDQSV